MKKGRTDSASRLIRASPRAIWQAFTNPEALAKWLPPKGMTGQIDVFEPCAGGALHMTLTYEDESGAAAGKTTENSDTVEGRFLELAENEKVVQRFEFVSDDPAFAGAMTMTWTLTAVPEGTAVAVICENVPEGISREDHEPGLASSLENLAAFTE